jgi:hypothetical protein
LEDADDDGKKTHRKQSQKYIDLTGIPPQSPLPRSIAGVPIKGVNGRIKVGVSKYQGVAYNSKAQIQVGGKQRYIGRYRYDNEEEAALIMLVLYLNTIPTKLKSQTSTGAEIHRFGRCSTTVTHSQKQQEGQSFKVPRVTNGTR